MQCRAIHPKENNMVQEWPRKPTPLKILRKNLAGDKLSQLFLHLQLYYIRGFTDEVMGNVTREIVPVVLKSAPHLHTVLPF